jgi:hypothetical protein
MPQAEGPHFKWMGFEFWAERGLVTLVDTNLAGDSKADIHKAIQRLSPAEFLKRAMAIRMADPEKYPSETKAFEKLFDKAVATCKLAKAQGDPTDPKVVEHVVKHQRRSSILTPGDQNRILGPVGGDRFKLATKSPREIMRSGTPVVPDFTLAPQDVVTLERARQMRVKQARRR